MGRQGAALLCAIVTVLAACPASAGAAAGFPDRSFGDGGTSVVPVGGVRFFINGAIGASAADVTVLRDGKIVLAGSAFRSSGALHEATAVVVARLNPDGSLDPTFDGDGKAYFALGSNSSASSVVQVRGRLYVAGQVDDPVASDWFVMRLNSNGTLHLPFGGGDGIATHQVGSERHSLDQVSELVVDRDGSMLLIGTDGPGPTRAAIMRLDPFGRLLTDFGNSGLATVQTGGGPTGGAGGFRLASGQIVLGGDTFEPRFEGSTFVGKDAQPFLARLDANGQPSGDSGTDGVAVLDTPAGEDYSISGVVKGASDTLVLAGQRFAPSRAGAIVRATAAGTLDPSFDVDGVRIMPEAVVFSGVAGQRDGKLVVVGTGSHDGLASMMVARLTTSGAPDPLWSGDGVAWISAGNRGDGLTVDVQPDTRVVAAGAASDTGTLGLLVGRLHGDTTSSAAASSTTPLASLGTRGRSMRKLIAGRLRLSARCVRACSVSITLKRAVPSAGTARNAADRGTIATGSAARTKAGNLVVRLRPIAGLRRKLDGVRSLRATAIVQTRDGATGKRYGSTRAITLTR